MGYAIAWVAFQGIEVPLQVAKTLTGFKHDEESPGVDGDNFVVLNADARASGRRWWEIWK
jgi:hypothetical protein